MTRQGKIWGDTTEFLKNETASVHYLSIKKGCYSSEHRHAHKSNLFFVIRGMLEVTIFREKGNYEYQDITVLTDGQTTTIPPGLWHRFRALEETECIEIYQVCLEDPDIERRSQGG